MNLHQSTVLQVWQLSTTLLLAALIFSPGYILAEGPQYQIYPPSKASGEATQPSVSLTVPTEGRVRLILVRSGEAADKIDLSLSSFVDEQGNQVEVKIRIAEDTERASSTRIDGVEINRGVLPLTLEVPDLPTPGNYSGYLFLSRDRNVLNSYRISLTRAKVVSPATLVLDQQVLTVPFTRPFLPNRRIGPEFTVHLRENSRQLKIDGLFLRLVQADASNEAFDPKQSLSFEVNGKEIKDFWSLSPVDKNEPAQRVIEPGDQVSVKGTFRGLTPGEYSTKLQFLAHNSQESDRQELSLTVKVRDSIWWVVIALTFAIAFSFFTSKWLKTRLRRLQFRKRLSEQRPIWLRNEPSVLSVVWTRAMFKQVEDLSRRWLLSSIDILDTRLTQATALLKPLDRVRKIRRKIQLLQQDIMVIRRAEKVLRSIVARLGTGPIDEKLTAEIDADLTELEAWFQPGPLKDYYGKDLERDVTRLLVGVRLNEVTDDHHREVLNELDRDLKGAQKGTVERERKYAVLKILWKRRHETEFGNLINLCAATEPVESLFKKADDAAWKRLKAAADNQKFEFISPKQATPEPREAYQSLRFEVAPIDRAVGDNYLFKRGLRYEWNIELVEPLPPCWKLRRKSRSLTLTPVTREPFVVQYVPKPGRLTMSVKICYGEDSFEFTGLELQITKSSDFRWQRAFQAVELGAVGAAWLVALASGLLMFYVDNFTFGSAKDYLTLLLWGAGADQTKNFLQNMEIFSGSSPAAPVGAG